MSLVLLPLVWLWPCVFGGRTFVPYDTAEFPPASLLLAPAEVASIRAGKNHDVTEVPPWFLPDLRLARAELAEGRLPLWNPHARSGTPIHAYAQLGLLYPPNWLALAAPDPASALVFLAWLSLAIAGLLTFGLLREVGLPPIAAWFGAVTFQLSATMAAHAFFWMHLASTAWLPGLLWALLRLARHDTLRGGAFAAVAVTFALPWLAGFPPFAMSSAAVGALLGLWLVGERIVREGPRAAVRLALWLAAAFALGAMLAMPQILPSWLFFPLSARTPNESLEQIAASRFDLYGLLGYLLPDLISHPTASHVLPYGTAPLALWLCDRVRPDGAGGLPQYNYTEYAVFFGTLGLLFAGLGAVCGRGARRPFVITALLFVLGLALFVPGVRLLYGLPGFNFVFPMRWLAHGTLLFSWLAALGLASLLDGGRARAWSLAAIALLLVGVVTYASRVLNWNSHELAEAIAQRIKVTELGEPLTAAMVEGYVNGTDGIDRFAAAIERAGSESLRARGWLLANAVLLAAFGAFVGRARVRHVLLGTLLLGTVVELAMHGRPLLRGCELHHPVETPVHEFLRGKARESREQGGFMIARASPAPAYPAQLPPGQLLEPGLRDLHVYTLYDARSIEPLRRLLGPELWPQIASKGYLEATLPETVRDLPYSPLAHPLLDLLGVRYLLSIEKLVHAGTRVGPELKGPGGEFFVYERPNWLPRAFVVPELRLVTSDEAVLQAMVDPAFAPRDYALATAADAAGLASATSTAPPRSVRFAIDHPTEIELEVGPGEAPWLVLTDTYLPGWTATIDGAEVPIVRADHAYRLVHLPATGCRVRFTYHSPGLATGSWLAAFATLVLLLTTIHSRRRAANARPA